MNTQESEDYMGSARVYGSCSVFFFSSRRRHTRLQGDWSSDVCSSDLDSVIPTSVLSLAAVEIGHRNRIRRRVRGLQHETIGARRGRNWTSQIGDHRDRKSVV